MVLSRFIICSVDTSSHNQASNDILLSIKFVLGYIGYMTVVDLSLGFEWFKVGRF
jgi:hypothetical protein